MNFFKKLMITAMVLAIAMTLCFAVAASAEEGNQNVNEGPAVVNEGENLQVKPTAENESGETVVVSNPTNLAPQQVVKHMVSFLNWDDEVIVSFEMNDGEKIEVPALLNPTQEKHNFLYWTDVTSIDNEEFEFGKAVHGELVLKAVFELIPVEINEESTIEETVELTIEENEDENENEENELVVIILEDEEMEDDGLVELEDDEVALAGPSTMQSVPQRSVKITSNLGASVNENDTVTLRGELIGFDGCEVTLQWQFNDGTGWTNVEGANDITCSFLANAESINNDWRLAVSVAA